jgi:hypothetical protein
MSRFAKVGVMAAVVVALGMVGWVGSRVVQRGRYAVAHSTFGAGPTGAKALRDLAEALGGRPTRLVEDPARLPEQAMLVVLGGCGGGRPASPMDLDALRGWVERGGVLLAAGARHVVGRGAGLGGHLTGGCPPPSWLESLLSSTAEDTDGPRDLEGSDDEAPSFNAMEAPLHFAHPVAGPVEGVGLVALESPARIVVDPGTEGEVLLAEAAAHPPDLDGPPASELGSVSAVAFRRGRGVVILMASASPFQNQSLGWASGGVLFARLYAEYADGAPILFDEYHLGVGEPRSLARYIRQVGGGPAVLQLLFVAMLLLWTGGVRFGAPRTDPPPPPAGTSSYVDAIARLYRRSGDAHGAMRILVKRALTRVARHHHLPSADPEALAKTLDARMRSGEARAVRRLAAMGGAAGAERSLPASVRALDRQVEASTTPDSQDFP